MEAFIYIDGTPGTGSRIRILYISKWQNRSAPADKGYIWRVAGSNLNSIGLLMDQVITV